MEWNQINMMPESRETVEAQQIKPSASFDIQLRFKVQPPCSYQNFVYYDQKTNLCKILSKSMYLNITIIL